MKIFHQFAHASSILWVKLAFILFVSIFVPLALLGYFSYESSKSQLEDVTSVFIKDNLKNNAVRLNDFFNEVNSRTYDIMTSDKLQKILRQSAPEDFFAEVSFVTELKGIIEELRGPYNVYIFPIELSKYPNYKSLYVLSSDHNGYNFHLMEPNSTLFEQVIRSGGRAAWITELNTATGKREFVYLRYIPNLFDYTPIAVLAVHIPDSVMQKQFITPKQYSSYRLSLYDDNNQMLYSTLNSANQDESLAQWASSEKIGGFFRLSASKTRYYVDSEPLDLMDWRLVATIPEAELTDRIEAIRQYTFVIVAVVMAVMGLLIFFIARKFSSPIHSIVKHMIKVKRGKLAPFPDYLQRPDEIGQLVRGYNSMVSGMLELLHNTKKVETEKRQLEMQMLINQINPHFLYNTLDAIKWRAEAIREQRLAEMVTTLASLLRFSLNEDEFTTVEQEIEHARSYLHIEQMRKEQSFETLFYIQPGAAQLKIVRLILQPIVENAVRHGMNKRADNQGKIMVSVYVEAGTLLCMVQDNGQGDQGNGGRRGIGLQNVHRRLQLHFGVNYGIEICNEPFSGFKAMIKHPVITENNAKP